MTGRPNIVVAVLVLVLFLFGIATSLVACAGADHSQAPHDSQHCLIQCACYPAAILPTNDSAPVVVRANQLVVVDESLTLPLVPASIFNPPKV